MPRVSSSSKGKTRLDPLHVQLGDDETYSKFGRISSTSKREKKRPDEDENELDVGLSWHCLAFDELMMFPGSTRRQDLSQDIRSCEGPARRA
jgi:hypothetical protein